MAVNHLKSKGSDCNDVGDPGRATAAGNCNVTRTGAAEALVDWLATDPTGSGDTDDLVIGDLNSYDKEDPIERRAGSDEPARPDDYTDLDPTFQGEEPTRTCSTARSATSTTPGEPSLLDRSPERPSGTSTPTSRT